MGTGEGRLKKLIVTADDFGLSLPVNEAVEQAHLGGILTAASLMVGEAAAADAVARARRLPGLGVGLHVAVTRARPVSPPEVIPDLVDGAGLLRGDLAGAGFRFFFLPRVRRQLAAEIRAQFEAFAATGLALDHVNAHNHLHLHPTVLGLILGIGAEHGLKAVRVPYEPYGEARRLFGDHGLARLVNGLFFGPWTGLMRRRLKRAGIHCTDRLFGLADSGRMDARRLAAVVTGLPAGSTEIFCHPATGPWEGMDPAAVGYAFEDEFAALIDAAPVAAARAPGIQLIAFRDL